MNVLTRMTNWWRGRKTQPVRNPRCDLHSRPHLEALEDRDCPSVAFFGYNYGNSAFGIWAYNNASNDWRNILMYQRPVAMSEGFNGVLNNVANDPTLYASFNGLGTWSYSYTSNLWTKLTPITATAMSAATDNTLFVTSAVAGTWMLDGNGWRWLTWAKADSLAAVKDGFAYATFSAYGTLAYNNFSWTQISPVEANVMSTTTDGTLFASFTATGTSEYSEPRGGWTYLAAPATALVSMNLPWWPHQTWDTQLIASVPNSGTLYFRLGGTGTAMFTINSATTSVMGGGWGSSVYAAFDGLWAWPSSSSVYGWNQIHTVAPAMIAAD